MILNCNYNGIDFSSDRERVGEKWLYNYDKQRVINKIALGSTQSLIFQFAGAGDGILPKLTYYGSKGVKEVDLTRINTNLYQANFTMDTDLGFGMFKLTEGVEGGISFSENCEVVTEFNDEIAVLTAKNNDSRYGVMGANPFVMCLASSRWKSKKYYSDKIEYENSFGRKITLSSENNIFDHFSFLKLSQYQANVLKWFTDMNTFTINGITYQRVSDWSEVTDDNTELVDIAADFARAVWSEFDDAATTFSIMEGATAAEDNTIFDFLDRIKKINYGITLTPKV